MNFSNAVQIDEWLASLSPEEFAQLKAEVNPAFADQIDAARNEALTKTEAFLGHPAQWVDRDTTPGWIRLGMYDVLLKWWSGQGQTCLHQPDPQRPEPVFAAACKPGLVVCRRCTYLLVVRGEADRTCDGCGKVVAGTGEDLIRPVSIFVGALSFLFGVCVDCDADMPGNPDL